MTSPSRVLNLRKSCFPLISKRHILKTNRNFCMKFSGLIPYIVCSLSLKFWAILKTWKFCLYSNLGPLCATVAKRYLTKIPANISRIMKLAYFNISWAVPVLSNAPMVLLLCSCRGNFRRSWFFCRLSQRVLRQTHCDPPACCPPSRNQNQLRMPWLCHALACAAPILQEEVTG